MTVRKRKDTGKWVSDFYYNGQRIVKTLKFVRTKKEAENAEAVIMNKIFQQAYGFEAKPDKRFEDFVVETFLPYSETNKKTFYTDVLICRVLVLAFKGKTVRQISAPMIETFKQEFMATPTKHGSQRSHSTVNYYLSVLSKILSLAVDAELIESNPSHRVKKFRVNNQRMRVLSADEEGRLLGVLKDNDLVRGIITVALHTGLRRGEIFNLEWMDLDFDRGTIEVRESKSGKKRLVPMNRTVRELFKNRVRTGKYVFQNPRTGMKLTSVKKSFTGAIRNADIENFCFHDLRHTAASRMANMGSAGFSIQKILGHSDIRMTARYTHATDAALKRAVANLDVFSQFSNESVTENKEEATNFL